MTIAAKYWNQIRADLETNKNKAPKQVPKKKDLKQEKKPTKEIEEHKANFETSKGQAPVSSNKLKFHSQIKISCRSPTSIWTHFVLFQSAY